MTKTRKYLGLIGLILLPLFGYSQQTDLNTLYNQNPYLINPAAAGLQNCFSAYLNHRNQWVGINNSPVRNALTLDGRLIGAHGIGLDTRMYQAGLLQNFNVKLTYAYHLKLAKNAGLSFGISLGMIQQSFAFSEAVVTDYTDNTLLTGNQSDMGFSSDAGLLLSTQRLQFGISIPQVFARGLTIENPGVETSDFTLVQHMRVYGAYDVVQSDKWKITPSVLYRNAAFIGHQVDLGARAMWKNTIGLGAIYRTSYGIIGMVDLNIKDKFKLAYGYGFGGNNFTALSSGSHEIMLGIKLCRKERPEIVEEEVKDTIVEIVEEPIKEEPVQTDSIETVVEEPIAEKKPIDLDSLNKAFAVEDRLIMYDLNSAEDVNSNNRETVVQMVVKILEDNPDLSVITIGYTCDIGSSEYNQEISRKRAEDIRNELIKNGVDAQKIRTEARGESDPFAPNNSEANQRKNRRVQIVFER